MIQGMGDELKARENRLRRVAKRRGLVLSKSRRRDPGALDYGMYRVCAATAPDGLLVSSVSLNVIERFLDGYDARSSG